LHNTILFTFIYIACGLSDILDGYIARKTKTESELGAKLDSIADLLFFAVITVSVIVWMGNKIFDFLPFIVLIALIRFLNIIIALFKFHTFAILHSWGNKLTGVLLFTTPLFILFHQTVFLWIICIAAIVSAAEETVIHLTSEKLNINRQSFFIK
jgi:CDP-diacylglycerol--glycerol-3-phosphate 3-phosphatidyltransferase